MSTFFDPNLGELFGGVKGEWKFTNDFSSDLSIMKFNNNPYADFGQLPGFDRLPKFVQDKLKGSAIYSKSEITGWNRVEFQNQRLIDMFGSDVIFVPPQDEELLFYKAMENWFEGLAYGSEELGDPDGFIMSDELSNHKEYGLTSSLLSLFDK